MADMEILWGQELSVEKNKGSNSYKTSLKQPKVTKKITKNPNKCFKHPKITKYKISLLLSSASPSSPNWSSTLRALRGPAGRVEMVTGCIVWVFCFMISCFDLFVFYWFMVSNEF